jgi:hypothetical protein
VVGVVFLQVRGLPFSASSSTGLPGRGGASPLPTLSPVSAGGGCRVYRSSRLQIFFVACGFDDFVLGAHGDGV